MPTGGFMQLAALERIGVGQLMGEARLFFIASLLVSLLTFLAGLYFAQKSLEPAQRMFVRLEQFTHDASHELRTPLAVINSELDLALRTGDHERHIVAAKEEVKAGAALIDDLLGLAALDSTTLDGHPVDLSALVEREVERSAPLAQAEGVRLESLVQPGVVARADEGLATQLVANLLGNAIKFTPRDGVITVTLTRNALRVQDTGPGIATEDLAHVFERFYQADGSRSQDGHGLGLAIARNIAEVHSWRIGVQSRPGKGATFIVTF
jgi:signal transduction histidine kinase